MGYYFQSSRDLKEEGLLEPLWTGRVFKAMEATQAELAELGGRGSTGACGWGPAAGREVVERKARRKLLVTLDARCRHLDPHP